VRRRDFLARRGVGYAIRDPRLRRFDISSMGIRGHLAIQGLGRRLSRGIGPRIEGSGPLEKEAKFENVDQLLVSLRKLSTAWPSRSLRPTPWMSPAFDGGGRKFDRRARGLKPVDLRSVNVITSPMGRRKTRRRDGTLEFGCPSSLMAILP